MNTKTLNSIRVFNIRNNKGNPVENFFVVKMNGALAFQCRDCRIATVDIDNTTVTIFQGWNDSNTIDKFRNIFFKEYARLNTLSTKKGIEEALEKGEFADWKIKMYKP